VSPIRRAHALGAPTAVGLLGTWHGKRRLAGVDGREEAGNGGAVAATADVRKAASRRRPNRCNVSWRPISRWVYHVFMSTQSERAAEQRRVKLDAIEKQVEDGSLKIRQMTAKERKNFPPVPPKERKERGR
jgi:hypothetical protein